MFPIYRLPVVRAPRRRSWRASTPLMACAFAVALLTMACGTISRTPPAPTPADFPGLASVLSLSGISVTNVVSGDAGCADTDLAKTAIGFDAAGLDQTAPVRIHIFIFRNRDAYTRERPAVDRCAASFVTDPDAFESIDSSPFVVVGQGPWATAFRERLRVAIVSAAGTGG